MRASVLQAAILAVTVTVGWACAREAPEENAAAGTVREAARNIRERATNFVERAFLLKPAAVTNAPQTVQDLAPLILLEQPAAASMPAEPAVVYWEMDVAELGGMPRPRLTYTWRRPAGLNSATVPAEARALPEHQGVRITLDGNGRPVIWEVMPEQQGLRVVYVAASLEKAARDNRGAALPGRSYAIERELSATPGVVVARVLDDGPVPMGPIVYLRRDGEIATVICRCMPSQARENTGSALYELRSLSEAGTGVAQLRDNRELHELLRLPEKF